MQPIHTFRLADEEWRTFLRACGTVPPGLSASATLREFIRWYNNGCRDRLRLFPPVLFPAQSPAGIVKDMAKSFHREGERNGLGGD